MTPLRRSIYKLFRYLAIFVYFDDATNDIFDIFSLFFLPKM